MIETFFFGSADRMLAGVLHSNGRAGTAAASGTLVIPPLLQEGIASHRCLWWLAEKLAAENGLVLRFDAYGSGDSAGDGAQVTVQGLSDDTRTALEWMRKHIDGGTVRQLAFRSASIPLLQNASRSMMPVDLVLWDPVLSGKALVNAWEAQHLRQLNEAGRYPFVAATPESCDLLGFELDPAFLPALASFSAADFVLPAGSRVRIVAWQVGAELEAYVQEQQQYGVDIEVWKLDPPDQPDWEDTEKFEDQVFPRRSTVRLAEFLKEQRPWS